MTSKVGDIEDVTKEMLKSLESLAVNTPIDQVSCPPKNPKNKSKTTNGGDVGTKKKKKHAEYKTSAIATNTYRPSNVLAYDAWLDEINDALANGAQPVMVLTEVDDDILEQDLRIDYSGVGKNYKPRGKLDVPRRVVIRGEGASAGDASKSLVVTPKAFIAPEFDEDSYDDGINSNKEERRFWTAQEVQAATALGARRHGRRGRYRMWPHLIYPHMWMWMPWWWWPFMGNASTSVQEFAQGVEKIQYLDSE
jgi:hypothetical protein